MIPAAGTEWDEDGVLDGKRKGMTGRFFGFLTIENCFSVMQKQVMARDEHKIDLICCQF
jgi:hypothetical protein